MAIHDPVSDLLTRIRNAQARGHKTVSMPYTKFKESIVRVLAAEGYIQSYLATPEVPALKKLVLELKYSGRRIGVISRLKQISKPGRRAYQSVDKLPREMDGLGVVIVSTSKGVMSDRQARALKLGGEIICSVA